MYPSTVEKVLLTCTEQFIGLIKLLIILPVLTVRTEIPKAKRNV